DTEYFPSGMIGCPNRMVMAVMLAVLLFNLVRRRLRDLLDPPASKWACRSHGKWALNERSGDLTLNWPLLPSFRVADDSPRQRTRRSLTVRGAIGLDVLVESQHVAWVVLFL